MSGRPMPLFSLGNVERYILMQGHLSPHFRTNEQRQAKTTLESLQRKFGTDIKFEARSDGMEVGIKRKAGSGGSPCKRQRMPQSGGNDFVVAKFAF